MTEKAYRKKYGDDGTESIFGYTTKEDIYNGLLGILVAVLLSFLFILSLIFLSEEDKKSWPTAPANIKLHFANGDIYQANIDYLYIPNSSIGRYGGSTYSSFAGNVLHKAMLNDLNEVQSYKLVNSSVILEDGRRYSFYDASGISYNFDRNEINLYLWKEAPSKAELESFKLVE